MTKIFDLYGRFFESNRNFTTEHVKIVKIPRFFCLNCQIPCFSKFPGKVATLPVYMTNIFVIKFNNKIKKDSLDIPIQKINKIV